MYNRQMQRSAAILAFVVTFSGLVALLALANALQSSQSEAQEVHGKYLRVAPVRYDTFKITSRTTWRFPDSAQVTGVEEAVVDNQSGRVFVTQMKDGERLDLYLLSVTGASPAEVKITHMWQRHNGGNWYPVDFSRFVPVWNTSVASSLWASSPQLRSFKPVQHGSIKGYRLETLYPSLNTSTSTLRSTLTIDRVTYQLLEENSTWTSHRPDVDVTINSEIRRYDFAKPVIFPTGLPVP